MQKKENIFSNEVLTGKIFSRFMLPSIFALLASNLSNTIATAIVGNFLADDGLAAMSLVNPVSLLYFTLGAMIAVGSSIMSSICLGQGKKERAKEFFGLAFLLALAAGSVVSVLGLFFLSDLVTFLGTPDHLRLFVTDYCRFYIAGGTACLLFYLPFNFLRVQGRPEYSMYLLFIMGCTNVFLTLFFIKYLGMGVAGAAFAAIISMGGTFLIGCFFLFKKDAILYPAIRKCNFRDILDVLSSGSAAACNNLSRMVIVIYLNSFFSVMGTSTTLAIYTISRNINDLLLTVILGISQSIVPLISIFYGEKDNTHIRYVIKKALIFGNVLLFVFFVLIVFFSEHIISFFGVEDINLILENGGKFSLFCIAASLNLSFLNTFFVNYYSSVRRLSIPNFILWSKVLLLIFSAYGISRFFGIEHIWLCFILSEGGTFLCWVCVISICKNKICHYSKNPTNVLLLDPENEDETKSINLSIRLLDNEVIAASRSIEEFCKKNQMPLKKTMLVSLFVEELLMFVLKKGSKNEKQYIDIRLHVFVEKVVLRIRYCGKKFDPVKEYDEEDSDDVISEAMGVGLVKKMSSQLEYSDIFGINNLLVRL